MNEDLDEERARARVKFFNCVYSEVLNASNHRYPRGWVVLGKELLRCKVYNTIIKPERKCLNCVYFHERLGRR